MKTSNPKEYWKILNQGRAKKQPNIPIEDLFTFFQNLNAAPQGAGDQQGEFPFADDIDFERLNNEINSHISKDEIVACIKRLKNNKACGEDEVLNEYIKSTVDLFISIYEKLFHIILDTGILPDIWLIGNIKPMYKNKGNPHDPKKI